jgi:LDH2 family malate/lactate/ureidoglycolate dehydrogenase
MPARLSDWFDAYVNSGAERLPGDGRLARRQIAMKEGVLVPQSLLAQLRMLT